MKQKMLKLEVWCGFLTKWCKVCQGEMDLRRDIENLKLVLSENFRFLKRKKHMCMIIGDIRKDGDILTALPTVIAHGLSIGFQLRDIFIWKLVGKAGMNVARRGNHIDHNYLVVFLKP